MPNCTFGLTLYHSKSESCINLPLALESDIAMSSPVFPMASIPSCEHFVNIPATTLYQKRVDLVHRLREGPRLRRRHTKSRNGCVPCKQRRIKVSFSNFTYLFLKLTESNTDRDCSATKRSPFVITVPREENIAFGPVHFHQEPQSYLHHPRL